MVALGALPLISAGAAKAVSLSDAELLAWADRLDVCRAEKRRLDPDHEAAFYRWSRAIEASGLRVELHDGRMSIDTYHRETAKLAWETGFGGHPIAAVEQEIDDLENKVVTAKAATIAGIVAKARNVAWHLLTEEDFNGDRDEWDRMIFRSLVEDLCALVGFDIRAQAATSFRPHDETAVS